MVERILTDANRQRPHEVRLLLLRQLRARDGAGRNRTLPALLLVSLAQGPVGARCRADDLFHVEQCSTWNKAEKAGKERMLNIPKTGERVVCRQEFQMERKAVSLELRENPRGMLLRITERRSDGRMDKIIVPGSVEQLGLFQAKLQLIVDAAANA